MPAIEHYMTGTALRDGSAVYFDKPGLTFPNTVSNSQKTFTMMVEIPSFEYGISVNLDRAAQDAISDARSIEYADIPQEGGVH